MSSRIRIRIWLIGVATALGLIALQGASLRVSALAEADQEQSIQTDLSKIVVADAELARSVDDLASGRVATATFTLLQLPADLQQVAFSNPEARAWVERISYVLTSVPGAPQTDAIQIATDARQHLRKATALLQADRSRHAGVRSGLWSQMSRLAILGYIIIFAGGMGAYVIGHLPSRSAEQDASLEEMLAVADRAVRAALSIRPAVGSRRGIEVLGEEHELEIVEETAEVAEVHSEQNESTVSTPVVLKLAESQTAEPVTGIQIGADVLTTLRHELRTPLTVILGYAKELETELTGDQREFVRAIRSGGERLFDTLESLLQYAEIEGKSTVHAPELLDVHGTVEKVLKNLRPAAFEKRLNLMYRVTPEQTWVDADPGALETAITHLVRNAIKFTEEGLIVVGIEADEESVRITVSDTGIGMSEANIEHVMRPFNQESSGDDRRHEGLGLGLTISAHLIRANQGILEVESVPDEGSTFAIVLPRQAAPATTLRRAA